MVSLWKEIARSPSGRPSLEEKIRGGAVSKTNGRTYQHGNVCTCIESLGCSFRSTWTTSKLLGRADPRTHVENAANEIDVEDPTPLMDPVYLGCTQRERERETTVDYRAVRDKIELFRTWTATSGSERKFIANEINSSRHITALPTT